jgi:hypothetical protein
MGVLVLLRGRWARWRAWCSDVRYKGGKAGCIMSCIVYTMSPFTDCNSCTTPIVVFILLYLLLFNTTAYLVLISHLTDKGKRIHPKPLHRLSPSTKYEALHLQTNQPHHALTTPPHELAVARVLCAF